MKKNFFILIRHMIQTLVIFVFVAWSYVPEHVHHRKHVIATYYAAKFNGRKTALGDTFSNNGYTVATTEKKYLGKWITLVATGTGRMKRVFCNDLMNMRLKGKVHFDLTKRLMKYFSGKEENYQIL